jgi:hypothetical protein
VHTADAADETLRTEVPTKRLPQWML